MVKKRETLEMIDGTLYYSDDNWQTIWVRLRGDTEASKNDRVIVRKEEADRVRFLAVAQSSAGRS